MSYGRFGTLQRSKIGFGCLVAVGSIATAGIAEIEIQGKVFSKGIESISSSIQLSYQSPKESQQPEKLVTAGHVFYPFTYIGGEVTKFYPKIKSFFQSTSGVIDFLKTSGKEVIGGVGGFLSNLIEPQIFRKIFDNIHKKVGNFISFFVIGGSDRDSFIGLFRGGELDKTSLATKFLLGQEIEGNKYFKARSNVFSYLLLGGMDKPSEVTEKFKRLLTTIKELIDKLKGNGTSSSGGDRGKTEKNIYWLEIPTVDAYLKIRKGGKEKIFNTIGKGKVLTKIEKGQDDPDEAKSGVPNILDSGKSSDEQQHQK